MKARLGPVHPDTQNAMGSLAWTYQAGGKLDQALPLFEETLKLRKASQGPDHPDTLGLMNNLARFFVILKNYTEAETVFAWTWKKLNNMFNIRLM